MLPLFDSLAHPTLTGFWDGSKCDARFESLVSELRRADFAGACAIGLAGVGNYAHEPFMERCRRFPELIPVAGLNPHSALGLGAELDQIARLGFCGVKVHPRFSKIEMKPKVIGTIFREIAKRDLVIFYCTYLHSSIAEYPEQDPFFALVRALKMAPAARVVLVHGGGVELLRYAELVRFNDRLLLDLSMTMMKYRLSSIEHDLRFLFHNFDRRICIGSDYPEYSANDLRARFDELAFDVSDEKKENIGFRSLKSFLGVK